MKAPAVLGALGALGGLGLLWPAAAAAQRLEATLMAQATSHRLRVAGPVEQNSMTVPGVAVGVRLGALRVRAEGLFGSVSPSTANGFTIRTTSLAAGIRTTHVEIGAEAVARLRSAEGGAANALVRLGGGYGTLLADFGSGLGGAASLAVYPVASVVNSDPVQAALRAEVGATFTPRGGPVTLFASYRLLRLDYRPVGGAQPRLEQDAGMLVGVTYLKD